LKELVLAWKHVNPKAKLLLRGPDGADKDGLIELVKGTGLLDRTIFFPSPVTEDQLIAAACEADIGLIPYTPNNVIYRYACPNKLSQYMAAGLAILSNELDYVKSVVVENRIGIAVDHGDTAALVKAIDRFTSSKQEIAEMSRRALEVFRTKFNWQAVSRDLYQRIWEAVREKPSSPRADMDLTWIANGREMCRSVEDLGSAVTLFPQSAGVWRAEIDRLNEVYPAEIARLNEVYLTEVARLNEVYLAEVARLNEVYPAEIARLNEVYPAEIARLEKLYLASEEQLAQCRSEIARLGALPVIRIGRNLKARFRTAFAHRGRSQT
jgi:hypothetical protein